MNIIHYLIHTDTLILNNIVFSHHHYDILICNRIMIVRQILKKNISFLS